MKPITSILLIAAIVCYVFLPFLSMDLAGSITGLSYSAGLITENFSLTKTIFALLPFIACFGGIMLNYNKHRLWSIGTAVFIVSGIVFFSFYHFFYQSWSLHHDPELIGDQAAVIEGFTVKELCIGYYASSSLMWLAILSCIISMLPFKFNQTLEQSIDHTLEKSISKGKNGISKVHSEIREELSSIESKVKLPEKADATQEAEQEPKDREEASPDASHNAYMPPQDDDHSAYMPK